MYDDFDRSMRIGHFMFDDPHIKPWGVDVYILSRLLKYS